MLIKRYLNEIGDKFKGALRTDIEIEREKYILFLEKPMSFLRDEIFGASILPHQNITLHSKLVLRILSFV